MNLDAMDNLDSMEEGFSDYVIYVEAVLDADAEENEEADASGPISTRAVPAKSKTVLYKKITFSNREFKSTIHASMILEWINAKSNEIQLYINRLNEYDNNRLEWNVYADFDRAIEWAEETGEKIPP